MADNYRQRCSVALMRAWNRRAVVCAHTQRVPIGELVDAVLAVPNPELEELRRQIATMDQLDKIAIDDWAQANRELKAEVDRLREENAKLLLAANPSKVGAVKRLVDGVTRLVRLERDDARAALARVRAEVDRLCHEPHPSHDHVCPDDVRRAVLTAIEGTDSDHRG